MESIAVSEIRREIIYCANHREASAVSKFLADYSEVRGLADRLTFLAPACDRGSNHE